MYIPCISACREYGWMGTDLGVLVLCIDWYWGGP